MCKLPNVLTQNLSIWPLSPSYVGKAPHHGFILGFGNTTTTEIPRAVHLLRNLLAKKLKSDFGVC